MGKVRRRVLRPTTTISAAEQRERHRLQKKHEQLAKDRAALDRWMSKLKRAFHAMEKLQTKIARLEKDSAPTRSLLISRGMLPRFILFAFLKGGFHDAC